MEEKVERALYLNCLDDEKGLSKLKKIVCKFKWFKKYEPSELDAELIESVLKKVGKKYGLKLSKVEYMNKHSYSYTILLEDGKWLETVYANTMLEGLLKSVIVMYAYLNYEMEFKLK